MIKRTFTVDAFATLPTYADPALVRSAQDYVLLQQLVRMPVSISKDGQVEGDALQSWTIKDRTHFRLELKADLKWSDGTKISVHDLNHAILRQMRLKTAVHFNFDDIESTKVADELTLEIVLKKPNVRFIRQLAHPEFGLIKLHQKDKLTCDDHVVSSGPYNCKSIADSSYLLKSNTFYKAIQNTPKEVILESSPVHEQIKKLKKTQIDLMIPSNFLTQDQREDLLKSKNLYEYDPHVGFTFWISLNGNSKVLSKKESRQYVQKLLSGLNLDFSSITPYWQKADQLYLPGGFGRPETQELSKHWQKVKDIKEQSIKVISLLVSKSFLFLEQIKSLFDQAGIKLSVETYSDFNEYSQKVNATTFDLIQVNNDFSSLDISESLLVSLNPARPLIFVEEDDTKYNDILSSIISAADPEDIYKAAQKIGISLLDDAYIFPVAYYRMYFYFSKEVDVSNWSRLFPDVKFWKIKLDHTNN